MSNPLLRSFCSKCHKNGMECECTTFHPNIIVDTNRTIDEDFIERILTERSLGVKILTKEECVDLVRFVYDTGYISHEFHPRVHDIINDIERFLDENTTKDERAKILGRK